MIRFQEFNYLRRHALVERRKLNLDTSYFIDGNEYSRIFMMGYA